MLEKINVVYGDILDIEILVLRSIIFENYKSIIEDEC